MARLLIFTLIAFSLLFSCKKKIEESTETSVCIINNTVKYDSYKDYYLEVYKADSLYLEGNYECSYKILSRLFNKYDPINSLIYYEYNTYLASGYQVDDNFEICTGFKKLIKDFGYTESRISNNDIIVPPIHRTDFFKN